MKSNLNGGRWLARYSLLCAILLLSGSAYATFVDKSSAVLGAAVAPPTNCDSLAELVNDGKCEPSGTRACTQKYKKCNQGQGNKTMLCQEKTGLANEADGCMGGDECEARKADKVQQKDANNNDCVPNNNT